MHPKLNGLFALSLVSLFFSRPALADSPFLTNGIDAFKKGNYSEAVGLLGAAKPLEFDNPVWHYYMANSLFKLNQRADAIKEYKLAFDLAPQGQLKQYCQLALQSLDPATYATAAKRETGERAKTEVKDLMGRIPVVASQRPEVVSVVCGCPLCRRLDMILTDLQTKYGDQVKFTRTQMKTPGTKDVVDFDNHLKDIFDKYSVRDCPTVMVFNSRGGMQNVYSNNIPAQDLMKVVGELAESSPSTQFKNLADDRMSSQRKTIVDEYNGKVAEDQLRLDEEIKQVEKDTDQQIADLRGSVSYGRGRGYYAQNNQNQIEDLQNQAKAKIQALRDDSERRKQEWSKWADEKIHALDSTQTSKKPSTNNSTATPR
jgi:tetratricopeptide (TPR) repeat protein